MNAHLLLLPLLLALFFASKPTDGSKDAKAKNHAKPIDKVNSTLTTINTDNDIRRMSKETEGSSELAGNNATKIVEKAKYPKKVHALKKGPAKTPNYYAVTAAAPNGKSKRKKVLDVTAVFKDLPADDVEFIKELDKQFQLHGDKIKIKVVRDNSTETEKLTSKRTIDGELGYGSYQSQNGYVYERPKFMFYPYSQRSIAADVPGYYPPKTDVSIELSYSYELQPETYVEDQHPPKVLDVPRHPQQSAPQQDEHGGYEEPVIVLRIPGPTKYASHLQTLLQQYLEIRAAQYLRILEEAEKQQQQQHYAAQHAQHEDHQQVYQQQEQPQHAHVTAQEYAEPTVELQPPAHEQHYAQQAPPSTAEHGYAPEENYAHQVAPTPQAVVYPEIDQVYQSYKGRLNAQEVALHQQHLQRNKQHHQHQQQEQHVSYMPQEQVAYAPQHQAEIEQPQHEQQYYVQAAQQQGAQQYYYVPVAQIGPHGSHHYQNIYFMATAPQGAYNDHAAHEAPLQRQPIYVQEDEQGLQQQHYHEHQQQLRQHQHAHEQHELISAHAAAAADENSPRQTHTKVIYTQNAEKGAADYAGGYTLPSIRPYDGKSSIAAYHQQQQLQEQLLQEQQQHQLDNEQLQQHEQQRQYDYDTQIGAEHAQPSAAISPRPFNYHAHSAKPARRRNRRRGVATTTTTTTSATTTAAEDDEHLRKIREFVRENLGAKMSTAVEFKTTAIVKS
ncbi:GATA zinc finger domain-containing protein 10 [Eurosta solidaginis]|uniref:GATA zinc finger domain-containing protein 10 n=1 Tax=Eurosta solidaginis TaxID=178769 RepID=UPI003531191B